MSMNEETGNELCAVLAYVMATYDEYGYLPQARMLGYDYIVSNVRYTNGKFWLLVESPSREISEHLVWMPLKPEYAPVYTRFLMCELVERIGEVPQEFTDPELMGSFVMKG